MARRIVSAVGTGMMVSDVPTKRTEGWTLMRGRGGAGELVADGLSRLLSSRMLEDSVVVAVGADFCRLVGCRREGEVGGEESWRLLEVDCLEKESCNVNCRNEGASDCRSSEEIELCKYVVELDWFRCFFLLGLDLRMLLLLGVFFRFRRQGGEKDSPKWALASAGRRPGDRVVPS